MKIKTFYPLIILVLSFSIIVSSCKKKEEEDPTPTNELMEGVWKLESIVEENGPNITDTVTGWFPTFIQLNDANGFLSTAGPLWMYLVYGRSEFINISSKIDEVFNYGDLEMSLGDWYIDKNKVVDNFTLKARLRFPALETVNEIYEILPFDPPEFVADAIDLIIYHRFKNIGVSINDDDPDKMVWIIDNEVVADYNTVNNVGDPVVYVGVNPSNFSHCTITFKRAVKSLNDLAADAHSAGFGKVDLTD